MVKASELKKQILLEDLTKADLEKIAKIVKILSFKKGEHLFKEKEETQGLYLIHSGKVEISKTTPDGWKQTLAVLHGEHFLGELSIIERRLHEATAIALENTGVYLITRNDFEKMEKELIHKAMERAGGVATKAAKLLGMNYKAFLYRLEKFHLNGHSDSPSKKTGHD